MKKSSSLRYGLLLTAIAFIVNVMLPFYAVYSIPANDAKQMSSLFGDKVLICTSDGFKWFIWEDIQSGKEQPKTHSEIKCPVCYVAAHSLKHTFPVQTIQFSYAPDVHVLKFQLLRNGIFTPQLFKSDRQSRAPPFSFV